MIKEIYLTNNLLRNPSYWYKVDGEYQFHCPLNITIENLISQGIEKMTAFSLAHGYTRDNCTLAMNYRIPKETKQKIETPHKMIWDWCEKHCEEFLLDVVPPEYPYSFDVVEMETVFAKYVRAISLKHEMQFYLNQLSAWLNANAVDWEHLKQCPEQYKVNYIRFMNDKRNECNCEHCPHRNDGFESRYSYHPCGQQVCWVTAHCSHDEYDEFYDEEI